TSHNEYNDKVYHYVLTLTQSIKHCNEFYGFLAEKWLYYALLCTLVIKIRSLFSSTVISCEYIGTTGVYSYNTSHTSSPVSHCTSFSSMILTISSLSSTTKFSPPL